MSVDHDEPKLRILHVISGLDPRSGGTVAALVGWASALARAGVRVDVASTYGKGDDPTFVNSLRAQGVTVHMIGPAIRHLLGWHKDIASTLRPLIAQADVVHIHALWEEIQYCAARLSLAAGKPYVISPHGMLDPWSLSQRHLKKTIYMRMRLRKCLDGASAIAYTCQEERNLAMPLGIPAPAIVESLGLDLSEFNDLPPRGEFRQLHPALGDRPIVLFLARLHPKKGADLLFRGFAHAFADPATSPALVIAGPDSEGTRASLEQLARDLNVSDRVVFTGMLRGRERIAAMVDADLFALTSHQENFGIAIAEALAAGTPVLISNKVNIYREIEAAAVGGVVTLDVPVIARELHRWMTSQELRQAAAAKARQWALSTCNWDAIAHNWIGHYSRLSQIQNTKSSRTQDSTGENPHVLHVISGFDRKSGGPVAALEAQCQLMPRSKPINIAIVANNMTPYRLHLLQRIHRELPEVRLSSLLTHDDPLWKFSPEDLAEIGTVSFGTGETSEQQGKIRYQVHEWRKAGRMIDALKNKDVVAVILCGYVGAGRLRILSWCHRTGRKVLFSSDSNVKLDSPQGLARLIKRPLVEWVCRQVDAFLPCGTLGRAYFEKYGADPSRVFYFPYEPDFSLIEQIGEADMAAARNRFHLSAGRKRIVYCGRFVAIKRLDLLVEAFKQIAEVRPEWDLLLMGDGPLRPQVESLANSLLGTRVTITGHLDNQRMISSVYRCCDVFALCSDYDAWSLVLNEAAAAGLALVSSDVVGAAAELVQEGINGRTFAAGDLAALKSALLEVTDPATLNRMKESSRTICAHWRRMADPIVGLRNALSMLDVTCNT